MVDVSKFLSRADEAFKKRNYQYAIQMYLEALQVDPGHIESRKTLRMVLLKAVEDGTSVKAPPGKTMILNRDPKLALVEHEKSVVKEPRSVKYNTRVAEALSALGLHEAAGHIYQYIIDYCDKGKDNVAAMKAGAQAFIQAACTDLAQKLLSKAMRVSSGDKELADLQRNLAATSTLSRISAAGSSREMLKSSDATMELELLDKKVMSLDEVKKALGIVEARLKESPVDKLMIKKKAELFGKARKFEQAHDWLMSRYEDLDKPVDISDLAVKYKNQHFEYMLKLCEKKAKEEPAKADAYRAKAKEFEQERQIFQLGVYKRQVDDTPADLDKRYLFGKALFDAGRYTEAVTQLQKAIKSPKHGKVVGILLGRCYSRMKHLDLAAKQLQSILPHVAEHEEDLYYDIRYWLADVYDQQKLRDEAINLFQEIFMANAGFRDVGARLERLSKS